MCSSDLVQGVNTLTIDGLAPDMLADGVYLITLTPKSLEGSAGTASSAVVSVSEYGDSPVRVTCSNAQRLTLVSDTDKALAAASAAAARVNFPDAQRIVLIPTNAKPWLVALATVYAARNSVPLMFSATDKLTYAVKQDLVRRKATHAYIVGPDNQFSPKVLSTLKSIGLKTPLRSGSSTTTLVKALYPRTDQSPAVYVDFKASVKTVLQAVSFATATGWPLLDINKKNTTSTFALIKYFNLKGGLAIGSPQQIPEIGRAHV